MNRLNLLYDFIRGHLFRCPLIFLCNASVTLSACSILSCYSLSAPFDFRIIHGVEPFSYQCVNVLPRYARFVCYP